MFKKLAFLMDDVPGAAPGGTPPAAAPAAAPGTPSVPPAGAPPAAAAGTPPAAWSYAGKDENVKGWTQTKGWQSADAAVESAYNLEKLLGFDRAGRTVVLPKDDAPDAEKAAFYEKLGRPTDAKGYKLEIPQGVDPKFADWAAGTFHKLGISKGAAEGLTKEWNVEQGRIATAQAEAQRAEMAKQNEALKTEWGQAYDLKIETNFQFMRKLGVEQGAMEKMRDAVGVAEFNKMIDKMASATGEHKLIEGAGGGGGLLTPAQAKHEKSVLMASVHGDAKLFAQYQAKGDIYQKIMNYDKIIADSSAK